jgi:hypothetical protein
MEASMQLITDDQRAKMLASDERMARRRSRSAPRRPALDAGRQLQLALGRPIPTTRTFPSASSIAAAGFRNSRSCVSLSEITGLREGCGPPAERDLRFAADRSVRAYAASTAMLGRRAA